MSRWARLGWTILVVLPLVALGVLVARQFARGGLAALGTILVSQGGVLANTVGYGVGTATLAVALGWGLAHVRRLYVFPGRRVLHAVILAALVMPTFTFAMALVILLGHNGYAARLVGAPPVEVYGLMGLVTSGTLARLPYAYLTLVLAYRHLGVRELESAALLGASRWRTMRVVVWPRLRAPLLSAWLMVFADTVADLANPLVIGGGFRVVASRLYEAVNAEGDLASATAYGVLLLVPAVIYWVVTARLGVRRVADAVPETPVGRKPQGPAVALIGAAWALGAVIVVLVATVGVASVVPQGFGWSAYGEVLAGPYTRALATTVLLTLVSVPLAVVVGAGAGVAASRTRASLDRASRSWGLAVAVPSLVLGLGAFLAWSLVREAGHGPSRVLGAFAMIAAVHVLRNAPQVATATLSGLRDLVPDARDAATLLGARGPALVRLVYAPRLRPVLRRASVMSAARALTATSSVILLTDAQVPLLTARMLVEVDAGRLASAAAMAVVLGVLVALVGALANWGWRDARAD